MSLVTCALSLGGLLPPVGQQWGRTEGQDPSLGGGQVPGAFPRQLKGALCRAGAVVARHSRGVPLCWGTMLPGNTGGRIQGRWQRWAWGHHQPCPLRATASWPQIEAQPGLGDSAGRGRGCFRDIRDTQWMPQEAAGRKLGDRGPWGAGEDAAGTGMGTGLTSRQLDGSRLLGKAPCPLRTGSQAPLDTSHHHWATNSGWSGRVVATAVSPWVQSVGTQSHLGVILVALRQCSGTTSCCHIPLLSPEAPCPQPTPCPPCCPGLVSPTTGRGFAYRITWLGAPTYPTRDAWHRQPARTVTSLGTHAV